MFRNFPSNAVLACIMLVVPTSFAATVSWQSSTSSAPWVANDPIQTVPWDNDNSNSIQVSENTLYQEYDGHGGALNEIGWKALTMVSQSVRDSIVKLIFDPVAGCNFTNCRVSIGANDYSLTGFTLDDFSGDYTMAKFNIDRDKLYHIPFIKAGMALQPSLKVWGSPWSPPAWMKTSGTSLTSGSIKSDAQTFTALALYFAKAVQAYQKEGLHYYAVCPQNEPFWGGGSYPVCQWSGAQMRDFIRDYLGPRFKQDDVNGEIWLGTLNGADDDFAGQKRALTADCFNDSVANSYCTGAGYQYSPDMLDSTRRAYPDKRLMETETPCGGDISGNTLAANDWGYAEGNDNSMRQHYKNGAHAYMQWNIVLDREGRNWGRWSQNGMISIDTVTKKVTFNPQFHQVRHYCYIKPGAFRIATSGNFSSVVAFRNLDGENVLIATNTSGSNSTVAINFNGQKIKPTLPAHSFNTFRIAGTPIPPVSPFVKMEAEKFSKQSGVLIRPCDGGSGLTLIHPNDWTAYHNVDFGSGAATFEARVAGAAGGSIEVHLDSSNGPAAGICTIAASAAWGSVSCPLTGVNGRHALYLKFKGTGTANLLYINSFVFTPGNSAALTTQVSVSAESHSNIVVFNGLTMMLPGAAGKRNGFSVYNLSGKLICHAQNGREAMEKIKNAELRRGLYIIK